jgi:hypothetical protein
MTLIFVPSTVPVQKQPFSKQSTGKTTSSFGGTGMAFAMFASSSDGLVWFRLVDAVGSCRTRMLLQSLIASSFECEKTLTLRYRKKD